MAMFSKIDKKVLIISVVVIAVIILASYLLYQYMSGSVATVKNSTDGAQTEQETPQVQIQADGIQVQGDNNRGSLTICMDECGNGVCQKSDPKCDSGDMNCICPETHQECPQDCK